MATAPGTWTGAGGLELRALGIDSVVVLARAPTFVSTCALTDIAEPGDDWDNVPFIAKGLRMPLREAWPELTDAAAELAAATARLLPGESLAPSAFDRVAELLRPAIGAVHRPLDSILRVGRDGEPVEVAALDVVRMALLDPRLRRVLALGYFDGDPALEDHGTYEYRISGQCPASDLQDSVHGFHTVPSSTPLPARFFIGQLCVTSSQPTRVELFAKGDGDVVVGRRGIRFGPRTEPSWLLPSLEDWSLVLDFPAAVHQVVLELAGADELKFAAARGGFPVAEGLVPTGLTPRLDFPTTPIDHLRIRGRGILLAVRVSKAPTSPVPIDVVLPPVKLEDTSLPPPPLLVSASSLQQPVEPIDDPEAPPIPRRELGFDVRWRPHPAGDLTVWSLASDDPPPVDAAVFEIERRPVGFLPTVPDELIADLMMMTRRGRPVDIPASVIARVRACAPRNRREGIDRAIVARDLRNLMFSLLLPLGPWQEVAGKGTMIVGDRDDAIHDATPFPGCDLLELFPEAMRRAPGAKVDLHFHDVLDSSGARPTPGSWYQHRVRARDEIGRASASWTESDPIRLEKHVPPPLPAGPLLIDDVPGPRPQGVHARVLVRNAPDLTAADAELLGDDHNAIVLRWGWHASERAQDPLAVEFRVYASRHPIAEVSGDVLDSELLGGGKWNVTLQLEREVATDAATGLRLRAPTAFHVRSHSAGALITAELETLVPDPDGGYPRPQNGPVILPLRPASSALRPSAWDERAWVEPLDDREDYEVVLRNRLILTEEHPRDGLWIGVSSADGQSYVADAHPSAAPRPGNESTVVAVRCSGRLWTPPELAPVLPPLDPVPRHRTPELRSEPLVFDLDLTPYLDAPELGPGTWLRPGRASVADVYRALRADEDDRVMGIDVGGNGADVEIMVPDADRNAMVSAIRAADAERLQDHHAVYLAGVHPYGDRLFFPAGSKSVAWGPFQDAIGASGRYVYRVRRANAGGLSAQTVMALVVVQVPGRAPLAVPRRLPALLGDPPELLRLEIDADPRVARLALFAHPGTGVAEARGAQLVRRARTGAPPADEGLRLHAGGQLLDPTLVALDDAGVDVDPVSGARRLTWGAPGPPGSRMLVWACSVAADGHSSLLVGPWAAQMPPPPVSLPSDATIVFSGGNALVSWTWPEGAPLELVSVERSSNGGSTWVRASPLVGATQASISAADPAASYRLRIHAADGRTATLDLAS